GGCAGAQLPLEHPVGGDEVEAGVGVEAGEEHAARRGLDGVPAHVGQHRRVEPLDGAGPLGAAAGLGAVLDAAGEQDLHADADAQHRPAAGQPPADDLLAAYALETGHARGERADARHHQAVALGRGLEVGRDGHAGARPGERPLRRAQVAGAVVEHDDVLAHHHITPANSAIAAPRPHTAAPVFIPCLISEITPPARNRERKTMTTAITLSVIARPWCWAPLSSAGRARPPRAAPGPEP